LKKILFLSILLLQSILFAKPSVVVSILPEKTFVEKIAKDKVDITLMVTPGNSPHSYEPKASQMIGLSNADVYFSIGVEFEEAWLDKFKSQNSHIRFINLSNNVSKIAMDNHHHHDVEKDSDTLEHHHENLDPHTWTSPKNVAIMAQTIYETLIALDPINQKFYKTNFDAFMQEIQNTDTKIQMILKDLKPKSTFMVFHPSWGYFAAQYNLTQVAVEIEGKSPKAKEMITIIDEAKEENVRVIFTQPEFSDKYARIIASEAKVKVKKISPLSANWSQNLIYMANSIANR
jgi:zinc transport system substrate-binding protein